MPATTTCSGAPGPMRSVGGDGIDRRPVRRCAGGRSCRSCECRSQHRLCRRRHTQLDRRPVRLELRRRAARRPGNDNFRCGAAAAMMRSPSLARRQHRCSSTQCAPATIHSMAVTATTYLLGGAGAVRLLAVTVSVVPGSDAGGCRLPTSLMPCRQCRGRCRRALACKLHRRSVRLEDYDDRLYALTPACDNSIRAEPATTTPASPGPREDGTGDPMAVSWRSDDRWR